jgi:esterase/lipase superfamily enzyme
MEIQYHVHYSANLQRHMEFKVYGHGGKPVLFIPCQSGRFFDFENFKMIDYWAPFIEAGRCTVYAVDSIDDEAFASTSNDKRWRIENHEKWFRYVTEEMVPTIRHMSGVRNGYDQKILTFGASMGATHAANLFFRRPDLFDGVFAISGYYESRDFLGDYMDNLVYDNCPVYYLPNLPGDHFYMDLYRQSKILIVVGQGAWEGPLVASTQKLEGVLRSKGIPARVEYWGHDVDHDWPWWFKMVEHYVPQLL